MTTPPAGPQEAKDAPRTWPNRAEFAAMTAAEVNAFFASRGIKQRVVEEAAVRGGAPAALREALDQALARFDTIGEHLRPDATDDDQHAVAQAWWFGSEEIRAALALSENTVDSLDDAWNAVERLLPAEASKMQIERVWIERKAAGHYVAMASAPDGHYYPGGAAVDADTPAAALHALAARLTATAASDASEEET